MVRLFLHISDWLGRSNLRYWGALTLTVVSLALLASRVALSADISAFFPRTDPQADYVLSHLKAMDRVTLIFEADSSSRTNLSSLADAAEDCAARLENALGSSADISLFFGDEQLEAMADIIFDHLPVLLKADELDAISQSLSSDSVRNRLHAVAATMRTPAGSFLAPIVSQDPLLFSAPVLRRLQDLRLGSSVSVSDGYLTSTDGNRLLLFIDAHAGFADTHSGESLADSISAITLSIESLHNVRIHAFGGPLVAVSNSRCVSRDESVTLSIALSVLAIVFFLVFGRVRSVALLLVPVVFGALFAFGVIGLLGLQLSVMAVGTGATVLGVALSYSIHAVTHGLHVPNRHTLIQEMAWPMTVGSLTTVGAFVALLFTGSQILRDLGLFASLALVGTLLFCLTFLPRLMLFGHSEGGPALSLVQRLAGHDYSRCRPLVAILAILFGICLFFFTDVRFNPDMSALGYKGDKRLAEAQSVLEETFDVGGHQSQVVVCANSLNELAIQANQLIARADSLRLSSGSVHRAVSLAPDFILPPDTVAARVARWQSLWTPQRKAQIQKDISTVAAECGFAPDAFDSFYASLSDSATCTPISLAEFTDSPVFSEWLSPSPQSLMLYVSLETDLASRDSVLSSLASQPAVVPTDMGYFARQMAQSIVADFNWLLALSSAIVAIALFVSYRRPELALMTFMPMAVGWVIILGLMAIFHVEFNVVNIILSTFIFGVGDDFAIFIMDGLQADYSNRPGVLASHKTAIALSAFAAIVGLGAQVFGQHPAVHSLGLISIFGLVAVIVISFVVQPVLFRLFISGPARTGHPFTLLSFSRTICIYLYFGVVCIVFQALGLISFILVHPSRVRRRVLHLIVYWCMRLFVTIVHPRVSIPRDIDFSHPSVIIANHLSMVDIVTFMATSPNVVFVIKKWVSGSLLMGLVTRMLGFYCAGQGSGEQMVDSMRKMVAEGYSIVIFPEGTRSADGIMHRFHKGAFVLARELALPITPVVFYGNEKVISRQQPWHIMNGLMATEVLPTIPVSDVQTSPEAIRKVRQQMQSVLDEMTRHYDPINPFFQESAYHKSLYHSCL